MDKTPNQDKQDVILELNFVPTWARRPPGVNPYQHVGEDDQKTDRKRHDRRSPDGRRDRPPRRDGNRGPRPGPQGERPPRPANRTDRRPDQRRGPGPGDRREPRPEREPRVDIPRLDVDVSFVPERRRLGVVVRQIRSANRAYPLQDVAALFLGKPENYLIKLELRRGEGKRSDVRLYQCEKCKCIYTEKEALIGHMLSLHLDDYFDVEEQQVEPPAGNFVCVGRCRLSGELLGPPNYHGFNERFQELHRTRFAHMRVEDYHKQIEMLHEPELIEQWKQSCCSRKVYRNKGGSEEVREMNWPEAEHFFTQHIAPSVIKPAARAIVPADVMQKMPGSPLRDIVRDAWHKEDRYPLSLMLALRPAFRHMHLFLFKAAGNTSFVTAVHPSPLDPTHAVSNIRNVLEFLGEHPGCKRQDIASFLCPDQPLDSKEVAEALSPLRWLIEKGHVVEFFDGTLSIPSSGRRSKKKK
ncbi:MAG: hypothetical protein EOM20_18075 [Spartobacteria bacterium]|nr:hypothetical protein [Spartobacteria bacterium]